MGTNRTKPCIIQIDGKGETGEAMKKLKFIFKGARDGKALIERGFSSMSVVRSSSRRTQPRLLFIESNEGQRLMIGSEPIDYAEREELGVLVFDTDAEGSRYERLLPLDKSFCGPNRLEKLIYRDKDVEAESGLVIISSTGKQITIMAGDMPYSLAIKGPFEGKEYDFVPELDFSAYTRVPCS